MPKLDESILRLQQAAAANAAAAAATSRSLDEQHKQARAQAVAEGKAGPDNKWVACMLMTCCVCVRVCVQSLNAQHKEARAQALVPLRLSMLNATPPSLEAR
eukprot:1161517-Pelagomonas_calceolata.AAC.3